MSFDFQSALNALKNGRPVRRAGWNGKGMWLVHVSGWSIISSGAMPKEAVGAFMADNFLPFICMFTAQRQFVPWLASQTDILAHDWEIIDVSAME